MKRCLAMATLVAGCVVACRRPAPTGDDIAAKPASATSVSAAHPSEAAPPSANTPDGAPEVALPSANDDDAAWMRAAPKSASSIGHTSVVFKVKLDDDRKAAVKPRSRRGARRYRGEIAAYRLGIALDLQHVPKVYFRSFDAQELKNAASGPAREVFDREVVTEESGRVHTALIPWIANLDFLPLETSEWRTKWSSWLRKGQSLTAEDKALAAQISTMLVFDYLTGNWDRLSGGNVGWDRDGKRILFIDNDGAFFESPPAASLEAQWRQLERVDRFSRSLTARLRQLDGLPALRRALGEEAEGAPLLPDSILRGVDARRQKVLQLIDARLQVQGEPETLFFD